MKESFIKNVIAALRLMQDTVFIFISSPGVPTAYYTRLMKNPSFKTVKFSMACATCEKGKQPWKCTHKMGEIPHWQSEESVAQSKRFLDDDPTVAYRELMGGTIDDSAKLFSQSLLDSIEALPEVGYRLQRPPHVYVSIDPAGGGSSHYAIASCFPVANVNVVSE